ncbi:MAG: DUF3786 domain-containing protein [Candidatus Scalindua sp.]|nr:DUF3786 domain-containing protein [Candidatus Scalindua sp.]
MSLSTGEERAWKILGDLKPEDVSRRAEVTYDKGECRYVLKSFGSEILVFPIEKKILSDSPAGEILLNKLSYFSRISILCYLSNARDILLTGELEKPEDFEAGQIYLKGSHILPLDKIAHRYGNDINGFLIRGEELGGEKSGYGDASLRLFPFPRIPVTIILWKGDEEFPPRADLLFDTTCKLHLPADIIWSTAMMSVMVML